MTKLEHGSVTKIILEEISAHNNRKWTFQPSRIVDGVQPILSGVDPKWSSQSATRSLQGRTHRILNRARCIERPYRVKFFYKVSDSITKEDCSGCQYKKNCPMSKSA